MALAWAAACWTHKEVARPAAAIADGGPPPSLPGGIADSNARVGFIVADRGQLTAIDLDTGTSLWTSTHASQPLAAVTHGASTLLAALAVDARAPTRPQIAILDAATGALVRLSEPIVLPDWATTAHAGGAAFSIRAIDATDPLVLEWHARLDWWGGTAAPPNYQARDSVEQVALDLSTGAIHRVEPHAVELPGAVKKVTSVPVATNDGWSTAPLVSGAWVAVLERAVDSPPFERVSMRRWARASGREQPSVPLLRGRSIIPSVTRDGREVVLLEGIPLDELPADKRVYWVYAIETGELLAKIPREQAAEGEVEVIGTHGFAMLPAAGGAQLVAYDAKTGARRWSRALYSPPAISPPP